MPLWITDRLILASPADAEYIRADPRAILLDAGQAFGTGTHPTTQMCLREIEAHLVAGDHVLDVGTGSGILAIAAARLGAGKVVAVDVNPHACRVARTNVGRNGLDRVVRIVAGTAEVLGRAEGFHLVLANLDSAGDAKTWLPSLSRFCRPGGKIILSGFQAPGEGPLVAAVGEANLARLARRTQAGWITFVLGKPA
jgi:ribosomal protein L11 methyltransferase